ncbi:hypothetical protein F4779DRAFT_618996 [Xylariaceae sp. FL0662B]|nr:hypothetical protein F4779DRAFT_618996 [Xylariaceae sp. FL0662B]
MDVTKAIEALQRALPSSQFALRGTDEYKALNSSTYQSGLNSDFNPACILQPKSKEEVSTFLTTIRPFVITGEAAFAIVGGGRQPAPGCSNINNGITLNLARLRGIDIHHGNVSIAAGELWGSVYEKLGEQGLGCAGSRSAKGGIAGLALTGGLSFFSSREGFICDDVVNYEVVLASGEVVNANANENADLWLALRGGGNNFGVVTRFDMKTFEQGPMYGGSLYYFNPSFPGQIKALVSELQKPDASNDTHLMVSLGYTAAFSSDPVALNQVYYTKAVEKPPVLDPFTSIEPQIPGMNTLRLQSLVEAAKEQAGEMSIPQRCAESLRQSLYMNTHVKADVGMLQAGADIWSAALDPIKACEGLICSYTLQPYPLSLLEISAKKGGNSLGLKPSLGPVVSIALLMYWVNANDDEKIIGASKAALEKIEQEAIARGQAIDFKFMNYSFNFQDPIGSYGAENKARLQEANKKYDPEGIFQKGVPGGWKLFP